MAKRALLTGFTGQDGSYLAELLLSKGYEVHALVRRLSTPNYGRVEHLLDKVEIIEGDLTDLASLSRAVRRSDPHEVYNLAAQAFVGTSWVQPILTSDVTGTGVVRLLEAVRAGAPQARFYQASSSEMYGMVDQSPQDESTPFHPRSPYAFAKVLGYHAAVNYRESFAFYACNGILFNHESPRRGIEFVTRKITDAVARIAEGKAEELRLGNLDARRDWGFAGDYMDAVWRMLQQKEPGDYVVATGKTHSVRDFCAAAFERAGVDRWERRVKVDPRFVRPAEAFAICGNAGKAGRVLKWKPKVEFKRLVAMMVDADLERVRHHAG